MLISQQVNILPPHWFSGPRLVSKSKHLAFDFTVSLPSTYIDTEGQGNTFGHEKRSMKPLTTPRSRKQTLCLRWYQISKVPKHFIGVKTKTEVFTFSG